ncbi:MAG: histidine phosphatase family protein [Jatrophihabitantaceae bacterium]
MTGRRLILIRHAKAAVGAVDLDRPLTPRGESDAAALGQLLARAGISPDRAVLSPARRARQTWDRAQEGLAQPVKAVLDQRIYGNDVGTLFGVVAEAEVDAGAAIGCLVLVGHNPSFAEFATAVDDGEGDREARERLRAGYPTSGVAVFELAGGWDALGPQSATLRSFDVGRGPA